MENARSVYDSAQNVNRGCILAADLPEVTIRLSEKDFAQGCSFLQLLQGQHRSDLRRVDGLVQWDLIDIVVCIDDWPESNMDLNPPHIKTTNKPDQFDHDIAV